MDNKKIVVTGNTFPWGEGIAYGGERILYYLVQELSKLNYDVYVFARRGCRFPNGIVKDYVPIDPLPDNRDAHYEAVIKYEQEHKVKFDLYMCNYFGESWNPEVINTHPYVELTWNCWCHIGWQLNKIPFNTIAYSKVLQADFFKCGIPTVMIHYGLPKDLYSLELGCEDYVVWIGKIEGGKVPRNAIELALAAGKKIVIMGPPYDMNCMRAEIIPYLDNPNVFWVRGVDDQKKKQIMSKATAFISSNANQWKEHFGIVNAEALAMGVPIIAFNKINKDCAIKVDGIIEDGKHGYFLEYNDSEDVQEIIDKGVPLLQKINQIDRRACRQQFEDKFTSELMAMRYSWLYTQVIGGKRLLNAEVPF